jgi:hypothetical protein
MRNNPIQSTIKNICGAKTRSGKPCPTPPVKNRSRCRIHGGAYGSGDQLGNKDAFKHGYYCRDAIEQRSFLHKSIKEYRQFCKEIDNM